MSLQDLLKTLCEQTYEWIAFQRNLHWPLARPLTGPEKAVLADFYGPQLLDSVRVRLGQAAENPPFYWQALDALQKLGIQTKFSLTGVAGITFVDCIVFPQPEASADVLFHELVHVVQYRVLGTRGFAERYVRGLAAAGFVYERNPLEQMAFDLQDRFRLGLRFDAERLAQSALQDAASA